VTGVEITNTSTTFTDMLVQDVNNDSFQDIVATHSSMSNLLYIHNGTSDLPQLK